MKDKLTAQDIVNFFKEKPTFDKSKTDSSILYGCPSTSNGLYSITDMYKYFENKGFKNKGFKNKDLDDLKDKYFQIQYSSIPHKMEKGKTHNLFAITIKNFNPDFKREPNFAYYYYDLSSEEVNKLKEQYENESRILTLNNTPKLASYISANRKSKNAKKSLN